MSVFRSLLLVFVLSAVPSWTKVAIYDCQIKERGQSGWIPKVVVIAHDQKSGEILVSDPIIFHFNDKQPVAAKIAVENAKRTTFSWSLKGVKNRAGQYAPHFSFRATYLKAKNSMLLTSSPSGFSNSFSGTGPCRVIQK